MDVGDLSNVSAGLAGSGGAAAAAILGPPAGHLPAAGIPGAGGGGGGGGGGLTGTINPSTATSAGWWTPTSTIVTAPANTDVMNQLCRVCGEPAAGFHFGAFTCEGCKSFFGRTYNNLGSISECKNGGACVINKKNRTACKACRLRKCLMVGMSKSGSRYGRRSNWFKIHCLLQEQSHQAQARLKDPKLPFEKVLSSLDAANNNSSNNGNNTGTGLPNAVAGNNSYQGRLPKLDDPRLRPQDLASLRSQQDSPRPQLVTRPPELVAGPHELLRPEASRFPMWRGPPFFHPALSHMHLLNSPFFPFQQRFVVPYVNQLGTPQIPVTSLSSSSSESVSPRSTPSPKQNPDNDVECNRDQNDSLRPSRIDHRVVTVNETVERTSQVTQDKSLAYLRSLGPEQDEPMDLSKKNMSGVTKNRGRDTEQSTSSGDEMMEDRTERGCTDGDENESSEAEVGPPLDLTRKT